MQITHDEVEPFWNTLRFSSFRPPRAAVAALFTLASPIVDPEDVYVGATWAKPGCTGSVTWTLLALTTGGLAIVTSTAEDQWDWRKEEQRKPESASVHARWVPLTQVRGVSFSLDVAGVESLGSQERGHHYGLQFWGSWALQLAGGEQIHLTADESEEAPNHPTRFVGRIRSAL